MMKIRIINRVTRISTAMLAMVLLLSCGKDTATAPQLSLSEAEVAFPAEGGVIKITISSNDEWSIDNPATWLALGPPAGGSGTTVIQLSTEVNLSGSTRSTTLIVNSENGQARRVKVSQTRRIYPSYNVSPKPADATGMSSNAVQLAAKMKLGWNLGNTFEAPGGETGWGSPVITEDFIKFVKSQGFNAIRIPCAWDWHHIEDTSSARIDPNWLKRVKEVIGYCVRNDMYVLLNIHWDGGWLENNNTLAKKELVSAKQKAYWEQIATAMRDFDEHLLFASANEPNTANAEEMKVLLEHHQTFVNAVRATGGRNTYRVLVIQGVTELITVEDFPSDPIPGRMMYEPHNYTPAQFTFLNGDANWGKMFYYWGKGLHSNIEPDRNPTWGEEDEQIKGFQFLKKNFLDKGIPILMGEYGAYRRGGSNYIPKDMETHNASVDYWISFVTKQAVDLGIVPFFWDTGGALDRSKLTVKDQRTIDAILAGAK